MRKKLLHLAVFMIICLLINSSDVFASFRCVYGTKVDDNGTWQKLFTFEVDSYDKIKVIQNESPELIDYINEENIEDVANKEKNKYYSMFLFSKNSPRDNQKQKIYLSMYENSSEYMKGIKDLCIQENANRDNKIPEESCACPRVLKYEFRHEHTLGDDTAYSAKLEHWLIYNDEMDKPEYEGDGWLNLDEESIQNDYLIEEHYKDELKNDLILGDCPTYSISMQIIDNILQSDGGCELTKEYDEELSRISEKCESLRATSTYTDESGLPKACQKACSNLDDEVDLKLETYCNIKPGEGCGGFGAKAVNWIFRIIRIMRYGLPAVVIILSILDYIRALASDDEGEMKKVNKRFFTRLLAVGLLFVIPFILDFILKLFNIPGLSSTNPFCAK